MGNKNNRKGGLMRPRPIVKVALVVALLAAIGSQRDIKFKTHKRYAEARRK